MRFLDNFFRRSPYVDVILQYRNSVLIQRSSSAADDQKNPEIISSKQVEDKQKDYGHCDTMIEEEYDI